MIKAIKYWIMETIHRAGAQSLCSGSRTWPAERKKSSDPLFWDCDILRGEKLLRSGKKGQLGRLSIEFEGHCTFDEVGWKTAEGVINFCVERPDVWGRAVHRHGHIGPPVTRCVHVQVKCMHVCIVSPQYVSELLASSYPVRCRRSEDSTCHQHLGMRVSRQLSYQG